MHQDVLTCPKEFNQNITGIFNSDFHPCSHSPPPRSLIIACRYLGYQSLTSAGHIRPAAQRHTFTVSLRLAAVFLIICPLPAVHSCCCFCVRPPPPDHSPAFTASPASSASSLSNTTDTSVRTQWEVFSSPPPLLQKSPCRAWAPKSFWQDSLSRHLPYKTFALLHSPVAPDWHAVSDKCSFFFLFFFTQSGTFLNCRQPRWKPREWSSTNRHL